MRAASSRPTRVSEKATQAAVVALLHKVGFRVWTIGTTRPNGDHRGTCQSPGLPDLLAFGRGRLLVVEVKARGGVLRPEQVAFRAECQAAGVAHVVGGVEDVWAWLSRMWTPLNGHRDVLPEEGEAD
jgi:hypothetical protein